MFYTFFFFLVCFVFIREFSFPELFLPVLRYIK